MTNTKKNSPGRNAMIGLLAWLGRCERRHDHCQPAIVNLGRNKAFRFPLCHQARALEVQSELKLDQHSGIRVIFRLKCGDRLNFFSQALSPAYITWPNADTFSLKCPWAEAIIFFAA